MIREPKLPTFPVVLAGVAAFLDIYSTQPLLPLLTRTFGASTFEAGLTITAPTVAVAIFAPFIGRLADRLGFRRVIVTESSHPFMNKWWPPGHIIGYEHTFTHTVFDLLEAMADERVPAPNFTDGVKNQKVMQAMENASKTREWVRV